MTHDYSSPCSTEVNGVHVRDADPAFTHLLRVPAIDSAPTAVVVGRQLALATVAIDSVAVAVALLAQTDDAITFEAP